MDEDESCGNQFRIPTLVRENFLRWRHIVLLVCELMKCDDHVTTEKQLSDAASATDKSLFERKRTLAFYTIARSVSKRNYLHLGCGQDPYAAFKNLEAIHQPRNPVRLTSLLGSFFGFQAREGQTVDQIVYALMKLQSSINFIGDYEHVSDALFKHQLLSAMPKSLNHLVVVIYGIGIAQFTIPELIFRLRQVEYRVQRQAQKHDEDRAC